MMKSEFEALTIRNGAGTISGMLYSTIEHFYTSENEYHAAHGGVDESKQEFCKRVFGGKVNTPHTIVKKMIAEAQRENRYALQGCPSATKSELDRMDKFIAEQIEFESRYDY